MEEYEEARRLRQAGMPFKRIATQLALSPSTVHLWTKDIELTAEQMERNRSGPLGPQSPERIQRRVDAIKRTHRARRSMAREGGRERARTGDALHQAGCMLYWAEGAKERNIVKFCNSDESMVRFFKNFLLTYFDVAPRRFRLSLHLYLGNGLTLQQVEQHWLQVLHLPHRSCGNRS